MVASVTGWGRRVAAVVPALVAGCAAGAGREPVRDPRPVVSAAPVASAAPVEAAKVSLGELAPALTTSPPGDYGTLTSWAVRYGRGVLRMSVDYGSFGGVSSCRLRGGNTESCAMYTVSTTGAAPGDDDWQASPEPLETLVSTPRRPPLSWDTLSPGRDVIYAYVVMGERGIDRIDERGDVTTWLADSALPDSTYSAMVFEVGARRFVLASDGSKGQLAEAREGKPGEKATVGAWSDMPMSAVPPYRQSAQGIRQVTLTDDVNKPVASKMMALVGSPVAVALPSNEWALVWIEGVAPPYKWPAGKPWRSPRKGRHECGGPSSRPAADVSIDKRVHLTRMRDTKVVSDVVLRSDSKIDPGRVVQVRAVEKGVAVDGITYSLAGKADGKAGGSKPEGKTRGEATPVDRALGRSTLPLGRDEEVQLTSFDAASGGSGQGVLVVKAGEEQWLRTFDAKGVFVGAPMKVKSTFKARDETERDEQLRWSSAARQGERWGLVDESGRHLLVLPEATLIDLPGPLVGAQFVRVGDRPHLVNVLEKELVEADIDLATRKVSEPVKRAFAPLPRQVRTVTPLDEKGATTWLAISQEADDPQAWQLWKLRPGATAWEATLGQKKVTDDYHPMFLMGSWSGPVVGFLDEKLVTRLRWLRTGEERAAGLGDGVFVSNALSEQSGAFVTFGSEGGWGVVPPAPGSLTMGAPDAAVFDRCTQAVATGPTTVVLACAEPIEPMKPGVQAGLRLVTTGR